MCVPGQISGGTVITRVEVGPGGRWLAHGGGVLMNSFAPFPWCRPCDRECLLMRSSCLQVWHLTLSFAPAFTRWHGSSSFAFWHDPEASPEADLSVNASCKIMTQLNFFPYKLPGLTHFFIAIQEQPYIYRESKNLVVFQSISLLGTLCCTRCAWVRWLWLLPWVRLPYRNHTPSDFSIAPWLLPSWDPLTPIV